MPLERQGHIRRVTPRFERFLEEEMGAVSLDNDGDSEERPDYVCLRGLLAVEIKSLEESADERIENVIGPERQKEDWPIFYGRVGSDALLKNLPEADRERLSKALTERAIRAIRRSIAKANNQLKQHTMRTGGRNIVRLLMIINEDFPEYSPKLVQYAVWKEIRRQTEGGQVRNRDIDCVVYISERHAALIENQQVVPLLSLHCPPMFNHPWKARLIELLLNRWAAWNDVPREHAPEINVGDFESVDHIPDCMPRHEAWRRYYRRNRYMADWTAEQLRDHLDGLIVRQQLFLGRNPPLTVPQELKMKSWAAFTHTIEEYNLRGLPMNTFQEDARLRLDSVIARLEYPKEVKNWLRNQFGLDMHV
ncbi:hypothetical protein ATN84_01980 [Paramesorhizobium deserti]|uniref:Uncharacterized protein n=1 Tax=Paramesorhizobium deserti TaxID=1494590 RepID=A0A135HZH1_9HYPH|nr:hypothetical protein [Paramesorhizobium deserti]KXF78587.1 hypothetical protein ATN84_01980 [Paramesorhizobium deserti]